MIGEKFNKLTVIELDHIDKNYTKHYKCRCDCGNYKVIDSYSIRSGRTKSCGCLNSSINGLSKSDIYHVWLTMKQRCFNTKSKAYNNYGGRNIIMCDKWKNDFLSFYCWALENGYKEGLTIDRINNNGNYNPDNCRWVSRKVQANNTRRNRYVKYLNQEKTITEWAEFFNRPIKEFARLYRLLGNLDEVNKYFVLREKGIPYNTSTRIVVAYKGETNTIKYFCKKLNINYETVCSRVYARGWSFDRALSEPVQKDYDIIHNNKHYTIASLAREYGINKATLAYHIKNKGEDAEYALKVCPKINEQTIRAGK